jgi:hypothetical protein
MSKKIYAENAKLYLAITIAQYNSGLIDRQEYCMRLDTLRKLTHPNSDINKNLHELEELQPREADVNIEGGSIYIGLPLDRTLLFFQRMRIYDQDPSPSFPHIHDNESNRRVNIFTGACDDGTYISPNNLANMWNDQQFIKRIRKNLWTIMLKRRPH